MEGIKSVTNMVPSLQFVKEVSRIGESSKAGVLKKFLKWEFQFLFELVNKVLLTCSEKRIFVSALDLFLMECLNNLK